VPYWSLEGNDWNRLGIAPFGRLSGVYRLTLPATAAGTNCPSLPLLCAIVAIENVPNEIQQQLQLLAEKDVQLEGIGSA
jgi:hypothetical protein